MKNTKILSIITLCICLAGFVLSLVNIFAYSEDFFGDLILTVMFAGTLFYFFIGYKIPHGNAFRYTLLLYALLLSVKLCIEKTDDSYVILLALSSVLASYMSGRLNKKNKCLIIILLVTLLEIAYTVITFNTSNDNILSVIILPLVWICLSLAYISRFSMHINAGKEE